ncbi:AGAP005165-PA [Anopheles gambiae str. PEST]|uniref:AGAP005165-PA n=1 Tax=Anopheles gambiae TaxID=7165 RepID=Q7PQ15_ANOGA|nr:AGAP005165-PA [Anopheles gambiae str. PEST]
MWLFGFMLIAIVCAAKCTEADISVEAAFQGRCGHGSPCEQLCYELHDGMYECDCSEGFELNKNGYSCQEINSTSSDDNASNGEEDVLYQRGASFSAKLDISDLHISMKSFDDDDGAEEAKTTSGGSGGRQGAVTKARPPSSANPNSINAKSDELARRKANRNWKLEPSSKQSANANEGRARSSSRKEKSIQNDGLPALVTAYGDGMRHDQRQQQHQQQHPKTSASGSDRRKFNATSAGRKGPGTGVDDTGTGSSNMPLASDMEISGISLHSPLSGRRGNAADTARREITSGGDGARCRDSLKNRISAQVETFTKSTEETDNLICFIWCNLNDSFFFSFNRFSQPCTLDCGSEGTCYISPEGSSSLMRCLCAFGKTGQRCEEDAKVNTPRFSKHSWVAFPALRGAYKHVQLHIEFRPESFDGILLLTGERDDLTGDFMALLLHQGFVEFWFDCGSGMGRVKSEETIVLNQWNTITIYRHRWDAWLVLNQGNRVQGRSKGLFSRITFREPVFLGGYGNITGLDRKLPVSTGFTGCIRKFVANDHDYNFQQGSLGDVSHGFDIQECITDRCSRYPCQHGGKCLPSDDGAICLCPLGFGGDLCEMRLDLQVPSFNGSSYLRYAPLGDSCIIWFELKIIIKPLLEDGLLLYSGHHEYGDYISLCLNMGHVEFTYDLGSGPATVRSEFPLSMGQWHTIKVSRTSRLAVLKIDQLPEVMTVSPNGFWHLSLPHSLYLGGIHNVHTLPTSLRDKGSFAGCIQKVDINDRTIAIISEALGGSNVENCPHACVARPCGPLAKCVPNLDTYECQCNPQNRQCNKAEELPSEVIEKQQRLLKRKQQEQAVAPPSSGNGYNQPRNRRRWNRYQSAAGEIKTAPPAASTANEADKQQSHANGAAETSSTVASPAASTTVKDPANIAHRLRRPEATPETLPASNKDTGSDEPSSSFADSEDHHDDDNDDSNSADDVAAYDGDGYGKDYDQHGDRIPYRPDFLLHRKQGSSWRSRGNRQNRPGQQGKQTEPEIDETLIEEMNRIMKNHNDNDNDADETLDASFWGVGPSSDGYGEPSLTQREYDLTETDAEETHDEGAHHHQHHDHRAPSHYRRRNGVEQEDDGDQHESKDTDHRQRQQQQQQQHQQQPQKPQADPRNDEDDILRSIKYKNKYFRKYQGACFTGTDSYFHYSDAETMRRVISYEIDLNLRFKTHSANGLILWTGRHSALEGDDFLSLGIENGYLHLRYNLGSGEINIKYNSTKVSDGLWHRVRALRNSQDGTLKVDGGKPITRRSPGKLRQLNTDTGLYVGGLPAAAHYTRQRYRTGMVGCISELILAGELRLNFDATILGTAHNVEPGAP